ncbi:MAG: cytochrome c biogenesis protein CcdA [Elusimicrobiota bacterium]
MNFSILGVHRTYAQESLSRTETLKRFETTEKAEEISFEKQGGIAAFVGVFLLGLALNLTPCVYPMLTITVSIFGAGGKFGKLRTFLRAGIYVLGIATMYSVLGVVAAFTGELFGGLLQSRTVIVSIALLFFILSLSMFGLYELKPPAFLSRGLGGDKTAGYAGLYLSGLFVGIFAAPCVGPPVIGLLTLVGQRGDPVFGFFIFFILSLGLGLPYLLLGTFSGLISKLPGSGDWMVWVRKLLGVALVGVGFFYISLAFSPDLVFVIIPLVLFSGGIYLGFIEKSGSTSSVFCWIKRVIGLIVVILGLILFFAGRETSVEWEAYSKDLEAEAADNDRPAVVYFSADWCIPCLELGRKTFADNQVMEKLSGYKLLKADLTDYDSPLARKVREEFDVTGVPTIVFLDKDGRELKGERVVGYISPDRFKEKINSVENLLTSEKRKNRVTSEEEEKKDTGIDLISDVQWIKPGSSFQVGVLFKMREGWHTYWINPGESGMKPEIEWDMPDNFSAKEIKWPAPEKFYEGDFITFGHEDSLLLSREITVPSHLKPGTTVSMRVKASWLICKEMCVSRDGAASLKLPVKSEPPVKIEKWTDKFKKINAQQPEVNPDWQFKINTEKDNLILKVFPPDEFQKEIIKKAEFFPLSSDIVHVEEYKWEKTEEGYRIKMTFKDSVPDGANFEGVIVIPGRAKEFRRVLSVKSEISR